MEHQTASVSYSAVCSCFDDPPERGFDLRRKMMLVKQSLTISITAIWTTKGVAEVNGCRAQPSVAGAIKRD